MITILSETAPVARKDYRCHGCLRAIKKGERHHAQAVKDGAEVGTTRMHERCKDLFSQAIAEGVIESREPMDEGFLLEIYPEELKS